ncbi:MAG: hypothetical protein R6V05_09165 [Candidatus Brocadiia bacterium]
MCDVEVALPITEGALYRDAFHGTSISQAETILRVGFSPSDEGWYGKGVYFWLGDLSAAVWFAREVRAYQSNWAVIRAVVDSGQTLNVDQLWCNKEIRRAVEDADWAEVRRRGWSSHHVKSRVAALCLLACEEAGIRIDSIFYFEPLRDLERPARALCLRSLARIKSKEIVDREQIPWRLGEE